MSLDRTFTLTITMDAVDEDDFINAVLDMKVREMREHVDEVLE
tara:strand:- start:97 stop:225 length:129 start_codon:yes stop_codon:yes gene_type:complete